MCLLTESGEFSIVFCCLTKLLVWDLVFLKATFFKKKKKGNIMLIAMIDKPRGCVHPSVDQVRMYNTI